jgi:hypothetical protein
MNYYVFLRRVLVLEYLDEFPLWDLNLNVFKSLDTFHLVDIRD